MAFSVSPSVIVREVDASAAVPAIATSPGAIAGAFRWGPTNEAILVSSENQLAARFGKPTNDNYETFFVAADYLSYANALFVSRADTGGVKASATFSYVDPEDANNTLIENHAFEGLYEGALGNSLDVAFTNSTGYMASLVDVADIPSVAISDNLINQQIAFNSKTVTFEVAPANRIQDVGAGDAIRIGNDSIGYQELTVASFTESSVLNAGNNQIIDGYQHTFTFVNSYTLAEEDLEALSLTRMWKYHASFGIAPSSVDNYHVVVVDRAGEVTGEPGSIVEIYDNVSTVAGATLADGRTNYYTTVITNQSGWVKVANTAHFEATNWDYESLVNGNDGTNETGATLGSLGAAYDVFKNTNDIDVSMILLGKGDDAGVRANYIVSNVADYRKDCVAFLSPSKEASVDSANPNSKMTNIIAHRNKIQNSSYWFMDSGYKYRYDKYNDLYRWTPLNGDMAGLAARVEPYESPAGFRKGIIKNVVKLAFNPNKAQRDQLYSSDVNPVMSQVGQGIMLFGDKTGLGLPSAFDRLNVRRLFIAIEKSIANAANSFLFELNDEFTQTQFKNMVEPFLREIQGRRGITDFRIVSDGTVNTAEVIDANKFKANIFVKPARSINVIELTFVATRSGIEFDEIVGSLT